MKNLLWTALAVGLIVLAWHPGNGVHASADRQPQRAAIVDSLDDVVDRAPLRIESASIQGDLLLLEVAYAGGCKVHDFKLHVEAGDPAASTPRAALLAHQDYGDACESPVSESLRFDLSPLAAADTDGGSIVLSLGGRDLFYR